MLKKYLYTRDKNYIKKKDYNDINFKQLESVNNLFYKSSTSIDDITWNDLNMNTIFTKINHTVTTPGEERLYIWLKNPLNNKKELENRMEFINTFEKNEVISKLRINLSKIGYFKFNFIETMKGKFLVNNFLLALVILLAIVNFGIIAYSLSIMQLFALPVLLVTTILSIFIHLKFTTEYGAQLQVLAYAIKILSFSKRNIKLLKQVTPELSNRLEEINESLVKVTKKGGVIFRVEGLDVFADYINIAFLVKEINFLLISKLINMHRDIIIEAYELIGELDAVLSINRYRKDLDYYCYPNINYNEEKIHMVDMYHPLVHNPVSNSIDINSSIAITGSNMSGKSTFLRSIGVNALFAQSICTSLSKEHRTSFYRLITSISLNDEITQGKSYFLMEAEAIQRMVNLKDDKYPSLVIIDEIFKGTNPVERLAASMEILNTLAAGNTKTLVATHDLEILPELLDYEKYYFTENVTKDALEFDYKIYRGVTTTRNAIKILEFMKYPDELITKINKRIDVVEI